MIVIQYVFLFLTGKEKEERVTEKKKEKKENKPHSWAKILDL